MLADLCEIDFRDFDHGLGAGVDVQFPQDFGNVRLDGRFRKLELVGDLLVLQAFADHFEHEKLLRRQIAQTLEDLLHACLFGALRGQRQELLGHINRAVENFADSVGKFLAGRRFGYVAGNPERNRLANHTAFFVAGHHDDRQLGVSRSNLNQPRKAGGSGQGKVQQGKVEVFVRRDNVKRAFDRTRLVDVCISVNELNGSLQSLAKQRMIVDDQEARHARTPTPNMPKSQRQIRRKSGSGEIPGAKLAASVGSRLLRELENPERTALVDILDLFGDIAAPQRDRAAPTGGDADHLLAVLLPGDRRGHDAGADVELPDHFAGLVVERLEVAFGGPREDETTRGGEHAAPKRGLVLVFPDDLVDE